MDVTNRVVEVVRKLHHVTVGDVVAQTGLPAPQILETLWKLISQLHGYVDVAQGGDVVFRFPPNFDPTQGERRAAFWRFVYGIFKSCYKVGLMLVLAVYFVIFVVLMVALMLAALSNNNSSSSSSGSWSSSSSSSSSSGSNVVALFDSTPSSSSYDRFDRSRSVSSYEPAEPSGMPIHEKVFAFVFGEEKAPVDPRRADAEAVAYARENQGWMTATELIALRGCTQAEAARDLAHLTFQNHGWVSVSEHGSFLYQMPDLVKTASGKGTYVFCWDRTEQPEEFNLNEPAVNWGCGLMNAFNLGWSTAVLAAPSILDVFGRDAESWAPMLGTVPFIFSALFFIIPIVRMLWMGDENARRQQRNEWRAGLRKLFNEHVRPAALVPFSVSSEVSADLLRRLAEAYGGREVPGGYVFDRLRQDFGDVRAARQGELKEQSRIGNVVYSTETAPQVKAVTAA